MIKDAGDDAPGLQRNVACAGMSVTAKSKLLPRTLSTRREVHIEEEGVQVKGQVEEEEIAERNRVRNKERTNNQVAHMDDYVDEVKCAPTRPRPQILVKETRASFPF